MADFLNLTGVGITRFTSLCMLAISTRLPGHSSSAAYLHNTVPSFSASSRSPAGSRSPSTSSIQLRTSLAACGVYLSIRSLRMSWSSDVTDAMVGRVGANQAGVVFGRVWSTLKYKVAVRCNNVCASKKPDSIFVVLLFEKYNDGIRCGESCCRQWWGYACLRTATPADVQPNVTDARRLAFELRPQKLYSRHHRTHNGGSTRPNQESMVSMEDAALPMAQKVACRRVAYLTISHYLCIVHPCFHRSNTRQASISRATLSGNSRMHYTPCAIGE